MGINELTAGNAKSGGGVYRITSYSKSWGSIGVGSGGILNHNKEGRRGQKTSTASRTEFRKKLKGLLIYPPKRE